MTRNHAADGSCRHFAEGSGGRSVEGCGSRAVNSVRLAVIDERHSLLSCSATAHTLVSAAY